MKRTSILGFLFLILTAAIASAQSAPPPASTAKSAAGQAFVDANGDGICDNIGQRAGTASRRGYGPGDGTGNKGVGPKDGTGYGPGAKSGNCTGTGPKGQGGKRNGQGGRR